MWSEWEAVLEDEFDYEFDRQVGRPRIEDRTQLPKTRATRANKKKAREKPRPKSDVYALVLHQMGCCRSRKEGGYDGIATHYAILADGRILHLQPIETYMHASNKFNSGSVAVEFAGNFPGTRGKCWKPEKHGCHQLTQAQLDSGRYLVEHLLREPGMKLTHILAHRQSSGLRPIDPGPDIWYHVGQWAIDKYGLKDGGPGFKIGSGRPIPDEWRTWGRRGGAIPAGPATPSAGALDFLSTLFGLPQTIIEAFKSGQESLAVRLAIARGQRDVNELTSLVFYARHPERRGRKLVRTEPGFQRLADEWLAIRDRLVKPALDGETWPG